jgi:hypothetical protein
MYAVQWYADLAYGAVNAVFFAATALLVLRRGALPTWLGWFAVVVAVNLGGAVRTWGDHGAAARARSCGSCVSVLMIVRRDALRTRS